MEVYTIGSGEIVFEVLKAVSLCLNGGSGLLKAMLTIGGFLSAFIVYYMILYGNIQEVIKSWGIPILLVTNMLFIPTTTVWVIDTITKYHYKIDHVPYGLAIFSSQTSKLGKAITEIIEQNFSLVDDLKYQRNGIVFGSDILEKAKTFRITNQNFKENMRNFVGQCVKYDIMLNQKYSFDDLRNTNNLWRLISSNPSEIRGLYWIPIAGDGKAVYVTCKQAVEKFNQAWSAELDRSFSVLGRKFFSGRFIGKAESNSSKLDMGSPMENALKVELMTNFSSIMGYLGEISESAQETLKQALMINAINDAASENSKMAGNVITYAETRALQQQNNTFDTIGRLAAKMLPIMKAVIEALAYACFIFVIPLCMVPSGYKFLMNWIAVLIWLQAWPPMYAILNYIMNIAARASTLSEMGTAGGLTIANYIGVSEANAEIKLLAGYLSMSIPFICIAIVKGVDTFVNLAGQMTGTSMQAASTAAGEVTTGNFSFGNISMRNRQADNVSQLQRNFSSSLMAGGHIQDTGGMQIKYDTNGFSTITQSVSSGPMDFSATFNDLEELRAGYNDYTEKANAASIHLQQAQSASENETIRLAHSLSQMTAGEISSKYGIGADKAQQISQDAKCLTQYYNGHNYTDQTYAQGAFSGGISGNTSIKDTVSGHLGGGVNSGVSSTNATNNNDSIQSSNANDFAKTKRRFDTATQDISASKRNDEVTQLAKDHVHTLSKMKQLSEDQTYNERMARSYQDSYNRASSLTVSERNNLIDHALEIGEKERRITKTQAQNMMRSHDIRDKEIIRSLYIEALARENTRMRPIQPQIKQSWGGYNRQQTKNKFAEEYTQAQQITKNAIAKQENDMNTKSLKQEQDNQDVKLAVNHTLEQRDYEISKTKSDIDNKQIAVQKKVDERGKKGAAISAWNKGKEAVKDVYEEGRTYLKKMTNK